MIVLCKFLMFNENSLNFQKRGPKQKNGLIRLGIESLQLYSQCNCVNVKYQNQLSRELRHGEFVTSR